MAKDTKQQILDVSQELFNKQGYSATSMRQIAKECSISVGNLCYHFNRKEELLMAYHNKIYFTIIDRLPKELMTLDPWCSYIGAEYGFLYQCASDPPIRKLYLDVINVPSLRKEYAQMHNELFLRFLSEEQLKKDSRKIFLSSVIASSIEYHMMEEYDAMEPEADFDQLFYYVFEVRMELLGISPEKRSEYIKKGFEFGKSIAKI